MSVDETCDAQVWNLSEDRFITCGSPMRADRRCVASAHPLTADRIAETERILGGGR